MRGRKQLYLPDSLKLDTVTIKKESPNEGTETGNDAVDILIIDGHKKRIPEWGDGNKYEKALSPLTIAYKKRIPEWGDGNNCSWHYSVFKEQ